MATFDEIVSAVEIVRAAAGDPIVGSVKEFLDSLVTPVSAVTEPAEAETTEKNSTTTSEVRVVDVKETR